MHNVLVTGGSRGIGLAIAQRLANSGYNVIAVARRESDDLRKAIGAATGQDSGRIHFRTFDLSEIDGIPAFVKGLRDEFGAIMVSSTMPVSGRKACSPRCTTARSRP